jgi:hypothetical protein
MLTLKRRTCRIGTSINTRAEHHGDDEVTALDIPLASIMLDAEELNSLLCDPHAHTRLYDTTKAGMPAEPGLPKLKDFKLAEKIEGAEVEIALAGDEVLKLTSCNLKSVTLSCELGGLTSMSVLVQCVPKLDSKISRLLERLDREAHVTIRCDGYGDQAKLPLGEPKAPEAEAEEPMSRTGRRIAATAARARNGKHTEASE